ncbi:MAG TPA: hypothetical protein VFQ45_04235, partial [Longimicrobium sp.]|nr:hypothetical protein [Longimicrobium sp.]
MTQATLGVPAAPAAGHASPSRPARERSGGRMLAAVADQAFYAGTVFVTTVLLARWLSPDAFGTHAVASAILALLVLVQTATIIEPMLIGRGAADGGDPRGYLGAATALNAALALVVAGTLGLAALGALALGMRPLAAAVGGLALAAPGALALILARRATYVLARETWAVAAGAANLALTTGVLVLLQRAGALTVFTALAAAGAATFSLSVLLVALLRPTWGVLRRGGGLRRMARQYGAYAAWGVPSHFLNWLPNNIFYIALAPLVGLHGAAAFRAVSNLVLPVRHVLSAAAVSLLPRLSGTLRTHGQGRFLSLLHRYVFAGLGLTALYFAAVWVAIDPVTAWLYGGRYTGLAPAGLILAVGPLFNVVSVGYVSALKVHDRLRAVFVTYLAAAVSSVAVGVPLAGWLGVEGAAAAVTLAGA